MVTVTGSPMFTAVDGLAWMSMEAGLVSGARCPMSSAAGAGSAARNSRPIGDIRRSSNQPGGELLDSGQRIPDTGRSRMYPPPPLPEEAAEGGERAAFGA